MAVASAGPYASLHLAPDRQPRQHPTTQFFYRPDALPAAQQQRQSTEGNRTSPQRAHNIYGNDLHTNYQFFPTNINCVVTLSQKISNMGVISNVNNNLAMYVGGNALTDLMHKSFLITTEKE